MEHFDYQVIEDNGGGLYLFVFDDNRIVFGLQNLEYLSSGDFMAMLEEIENGADAHTLARWDGHVTDPSGTYALMSGTESIATYINGKRVVHPDRMGRAGALAFGVEL